jgi:hypothetical protein
MSENVVSGEFVSPGTHEDMGVNIKMLYWMTIKLYVNRLWKGDSTGLCE